MPPVSQTARDLPASGPNPACEPCRARKIRCQRIENDLSNRCARCEKLNLSCLLHVPNTRRRRKRTDIRVSELENELKLLKQRIDATAEDGESSSTMVTRFTEGSDEASTLEQDALRKDPSHASIPNRTLARVPSNELQNATLEKLYNDEFIQEELLQRFSKELSPHLPFIHFEDMPSVKRLRQKEPSTWLAIMAASSASVYPELAQTLACLLDRRCAEQVIIEGRKSIDLVQALLINAIWYHPPDRFQDLKFTQYAHIAANMALDLRLGEVENRKITFDGSIAIETHRARTFTACHLISSSMALALRRPCMLAISDWTQNCSTKLMEAELVADKHLIAWAKLQNIAEESASAFGLFQGRSIDLHDRRNIFALNAFDKQLLSWRDDNWASAKSSLQIHFYYVRATLHEVSMHKDYASNEFRPPYLMRPKPNTSETSQLLPPSYISSLVICVESTQNLLDTFLGLSTDTLRCLPVILYTRLFYAIVVLCKVTISVQCPESGMYKMIEASSLKLFDYLYNSMNILKDAAGDEGFSVPATFYLIVTKLTAWYHKQFTASHGTADAGEILEPMAYMKSTELTAGNTLRAYRAASPSAGLEPTNTYANHIKDSLTTQRPNISTANYLRTLSYVPQSTESFAQMPQGMLQTQSSHASGSNTTESQPQILPNLSSWNLQAFHNFAEFDQFSSMNYFEDSSLLAFVNENIDHAEDPFPPT